MPTLSDPPNTVDNDGRLAELQRELARLTQENQMLLATNRRWRHIAGTDALTGLRNRIFFLTALLPQAIAQANAEGQSLSCLAIAPRGLGDDNAKYGRKLGDQVLTRVAGLLKQCVEEGEHLVHVGGTCFVLLIPDADLNRVKRRSMMVRARVQGQTVEGAEARVAVALSLGAVSRAPGQADDDASGEEVAVEFLRRLETALDQAKQMSGDLLYSDPETRF